MNYLKILFILLSTHLYGVEITDIPYFKEGQFVGTSQSTYANGETLKDKNVTLTHYITQKRKFLICECEFQDNNQTIKLKMKVSLIANNKGHYDFTLTSNINFEDKGYIKVISKDEYHTFSYLHSNKMITKTTFDKAQNQLTTSSKYIKENIVTSRTNSQYKYDPK